MNDEVVAQVDTKIIMLQILLSALPHDFRANSIENLSQPCEKQEGLCLALLFIATTSVTFFTWIAMFLACLKKGQVYPPVYPASYLVNLV